MRKQLLFAASSLIFIFLCAGSSFGEYNLSLTVPLYGQDTSYYCGAASSQMIMMGYPDVSSHKCFAQDAVYNTIQTKKQDNGFYTDPDGLRDTVMALDPPPAPGHFSIFSDANSGTVVTTLALGGD